MEVLVYFSVNKLIYNTFIDTVLNF